MTSELSVIHDTVEREGSCTCDFCIEYIGNLRYLSFIATCLFVCINISLRRPASKQRTTPSRPSYTEASSRCESFLVNE